MNKKLKIVSSLLLTSSLILTPLGINIGGNNIIYAKEDTNKIVVKEVKFTDKDFFDDVEKKYKENKISKTDYDYIISFKNDRSYLGNGENKIVFFNDGKCDIYMSSALANMALGAGSVVTSFIVGAFVATIPGIGTTFASGVGTAVGVIVGALASENIDVSRGIVAYFDILKLKVIHFRTQ